MTVKVWVGGTAATSTSPKSNGLAGLTDAAGTGARAPSPWSVALTLPPSVVTTRLPLTVGTAVGANSTITVQVPDGPVTGVEVSQVPPDTLKRDEPLMAIELMCRSALPSFPTTNVWVEVVPMVVVGKVKADWSMVACGAGATTAVPARVAVGRSPAGCGALNRTDTVLLLAPAEPVGWNATSKVQVPSETSADPSQWLLLSTNWLVSPRKNPTAWTFRVWFVLLVRVKVWVPEVEPRSVLPKSLLVGSRVVAGTTRTLPAYSVVPASSSLMEPETGMDVPI